MRVVSGRGLLVWLVCALATATLAGCSSGGSTGAGRPTTSLSSVESSDPNPADNGTDGQTGYLAADTSGAVFILWTNTDGNLNATIEISEPDSSNNADGGVQGQQLTATGTLQGQAVDLDVTDRGNWTGTVSGRTLTLHIPQTDGSLQAVTFTQATIGDYNTAVAQLHQQVQASAAAASSAAQQAAATRGVTQAEAAVAQDIDNLTAATGQLSADADFTADLTQMSKDLATEQHDLAVERGDVAPGNCGTVDGDDGTVNGDDGTLQGDQGTLQGTVGTVQADIDTVNQGVKTLAGDVTALKSAIADDPGTTATTPQDQVTAATQAGSAAVAAANAAIAKAKTQAATYLSQDQQLLEQAGDIANNCNE